ncbi:ALQxL family class IV lanthipeptide [Kitasatospora sp. NPDC056138]
MTETDLDALQTLPEEATESLRCRDEYTCAITLPCRVHFSTL